MSVFTAFGKLSATPLALETCAPIQHPALQSREKQRKHICKDVSTQVLATELPGVSSFRDKVHARPQRGTLGCDRCPCLGALVVASKN